MVVTVPLARLEDDADFVGTLTCSGMTPTDKKLGYVRVEAAVDGAVVVWGWVVGGRQSAPLGRGGS